MAQRTRYYARQETPEATGEWNLLAKTTREKGAKRAASMLFECGYSYEYTVIGIAHTRAGKITPILMKKTGNKQRWKGYNSNDIKNI